MAKTSIQSRRAKRQQLFIAEYLVTLNATKAAIAAGYSKKTARQQGQRLLTNVDIREAIDKAMDSRIERAEVTADYVLSTIMDTVERCRSLKTVTDRKGRTVEINTPEGKRAVLCQFDPFAVIKGCELLGKHLKLFTDRIEHSRVIRGMHDLTDEELQSISASLQHDEA
jgi:phage terminase small subunit